MRAATSNFVVDSVFTVLNNKLGVFFVGFSEEHVAFVKSDPKRAECLRTPAKPETHYRDKGWEGEEKFFDGK